MIFKYVHSLRVSDVVEFGADAEGPEPLKPYAVSDIDTKNEKVLLVPLFDSETPVVEYEYASEVPDVVRWLRSADVFVDGDGGTLGYR